MTLTKASASQSRYLAALDQGTTSTRFIIFDRQGASLVCAQEEHPQHLPQPGWVEHHPLDILHNAIRVIDSGLAQSGLEPGDIACMGITNQRETSVVWDRHTGQPVYNAIVWQDTRVADAVARLKNEGVESLIRAKSGLPLSTYFSALKIAWILDHVSGARSRAERGDLLFGNIDAYLLWHFTGGKLHITDVTNASRTQLMDLRTCEWDDQLLSLFAIPRAMLPQIRPSSEHYADLAISTLAGVPICSLLGDQQAALVGQNCLSPGDSKNTYGTGCFLLMNTGPAPVVSKAGLLTTVAYKFGNSAPTYALEGSVAVAGALVQWIRDNLGLIQHSDEVEALARTVEDNGGVYFVPAFSGLYAPYWKDSARGIVAGLTRFANKGHLARAVLEATALQTVDVVRAMEKDSGFQLQALRTDGGMVRNDLLMQTQANLLNCGVLRPRTRETTALGAAYAAGLACGFYESIEDLSANWVLDRRWEPDMPDTERRRHLHRWSKAVARSFDWEEAADHD